MKKLSCTIKKNGAVVRKKIFTIENQSYHMTEWGLLDGHGLEIIVSDRVDSFAETNKEKMEVFLDRMNGRLTGDEVDFLKGLAK